MAIMIGDNAQEDEILIILRPIQYEQPTLQTVPSLCEHNSRFSMALSSQREKSPARACPLVWVLKQPKREKMKSLQMLVLKRWKSSGQATQTRVLPLHSAMFGQNQSLTVRHPSNLKLLFGRLSGHCSPFTKQQER